jgi:hypothetical protein
MYLCFKSCSPFRLRNGLFPRLFLSQKVLKSLETSQEVLGCALFRVELALVAFLFFG